MHNGQDPDELLLDHVEKAVREAPEDLAAHAGNTNRGTDLGVSQDQTDGTADFSFESVGDARSCFLLVEV
jgi:hypothetical protein